MRDELRVENVRCGKCGAADRHLTDAAMWICGHCGAVVSTTGLLETMTAEGIRRGARLLFDPDRLDVRMTQVAVFMGRAHTERDPDRYRDAYGEYLLLQIQQHPDMVPPWASSGDALAAWLRYSVDAGVLCAFDPAIAAAMAELRAVDVYQSKDPVAAARAYYDRCRTYARVLMGHRDYPQWLRARCSVDQMARDTFVASLRAFVALMPPGTLTKIHCEVLGAEVVTGDGSAGACSVCGGPRRGADERCRWCGADVEVRADPWLADYCMRVEAMTARSAEERAANAVHLLLSPAHVGGVLPGAQVCFAALQAAVPWATRRTLLSALDIARHGLADHAGFAKLADDLTLALSEWQPTAEPPAPTTPRGPIRLEDAWSDPWVDMQLALFQTAQTSTDAATVAVSMARLPHGVGRPITPALAAAFLLRLELAGPALQSALALFTEAAEGDERNFLHEVANLVRDH